MKLLWIKWFPTDWLADAELSKTSLLGRGLWIECLNAMYNSDTFALTGTPEELSRVLRCSVAEFDTAMSDLALHNAAVLERRNGVVTLISRRLERLHKARDSGRLRKQSQRERQKCHTKVPSASVSASDPPEGKGVWGEGFQKPFPEVAETDTGGAGARRVGFPAFILKAEIGKHFNRKPTDHWTYEEERLLCDAARRESAESEWLEILAFRRLAGEHGEKLRASVKSLLENWQGELDRARSYKPPPKLGRDGKPESSESINTKQLRKMIQQ